MIQQGHLYRYKTLGKVIVLKILSNTLVYVLEVTEDPLSWNTFVTKAENLRPLPMRYFHGQLPA